MKTFVGTKTVKAEPCSLGEFIQRTGRNPYANDGKMHGSNEPGYIVEYQDGYQSWSPQASFDSAYRVAETFEDRLHIEVSDLSDKIQKLQKFLQSETFDTINDSSKAFLRTQYAFMQGYERALCSRLALLKDSYTKKIVKAHFHFVLPFLKQGFVCRRSSWAPDTVVFMQVPAIIPNEVIPKMQSLPKAVKDLLVKDGRSISYVNQCVKTNLYTKDITSWQPSIEDIFAEDWEVFMVE